MGKCGWIRICDLYHHGIMFFFFFFFVFGFCFETPPKQFVNTNNTNYVIQWMFRNYLQWPYHLNYICQLLLESPLICVRSIEVHHLNWPLRIFLIKQQPCLACPVRCVQPQARSELCAILLFKYQFKLKKKSIPHTHSFCYYESCICYKLLTKI